MVPTHPQFEQHGSFAHLPLGKLPARRDPRTLEYARYVPLAGLPVPPGKLGVPPVASWPMYGNDQLGDCTIAAAAHMVEAWYEDAGETVVPDTSLVVQAYWETGDPPASSGDAGGPTDTGRVELDVLNYWRKTGIAGDTIAAYVSVDPANRNDVQDAMFLFGGLYTGIALPVTAQGQAVWDVVGDGKTGDSEPGSWGGHAVPFLGYDETGVTLVTWGGLLNATWAFVKAYMDECYAVLSKDQLASTGITQAGFDLEQLTADLAELGT